MLVTPNNLRFFQTKIKKNFRREYGKDKEIAWIIYIIIIKIIYHLKIERVRLKSRMKNNPGYPGFLNEKIL
jgi:hypothetical protein